MEEPEEEGDCARSAWYKRERVKQRERERKTWDAAKVFGEKHNTITYEKKRKQFSIKATLFHAIDRWPNAATLRQIDRMN